METGVKPEKSNEKSIKQKKKKKNNKTKKSKTNQNKFKILKNDEYGKRKYI